MMLRMDGRDTDSCTLLSDMQEDAAGLDAASLLFTSTIEFSETLDLHAVFRQVHESGAYIICPGSGSTQYRKFVDRVLLDEETNSFSRIAALEGLMLSLSEVYRTRFIDGIEPDL